MTTKSRTIGTGMLGLMSLVAGGWGMPTASQAAADAVEPEAGGHFSAGLLYSGTRSPLAGTSNRPESHLVPWLAYKSERLSIDLSGVSVKLLGTGHVEVQGLLAPRWLAVDPDNSDLHDDLRRRIGFDIGTKVSAAFGPAMASLTYRGDVSGRIDGHEFTAEAGVGLPLPGNGQFMARGGAYWRNSKLNTWLYGVFASEARADRPEYEVKQGVTPFAGLMVSYPLAGKVSATLSAEAQYLADAAADSPIVARRVVPSAMFGLFYSF
jgi:outer membrane protein